MWKSGTTETTKIGYVNRNNQIVLGTRGIKGNDHGQLSYKLKCLNDDCEQEYGANGTDIFQRKCPECQGGIKGIDF
jgi:hypothetical protein